MKNKILNRVYKVIFHDLPNLAFSIKYLTRKVSSLDDKYEDLSRRLDKIEKNSE